MKKMIIALSALLITVPALSSAYTTTSQTALRLNDNSLLFLITYEFGHEDFSYRMPILAERNVENKDILSFDILKDGKLRTMEGKAGGIVLSDAKVENGKYLVNKNQSETFTLVTVLNLPSERAASSTDYALAVSALPFQFEKNGTWLNNQLSESELEPYRTAVIGTDQKIGITTK